MNRLAKELAMTLGSTCLSGALTTIFSGVSVLLLTGCASPGFPRPPSLHLAEPVSDLTATRIADRVELHWTAPNRTTDGLDLPVPATAEVCRDDVRRIPSSAPPPCTVVLKVAGHAGPSTAVDHLPAGLLSAQSAGLIAYRVRVLNSAGRSASPSAAAFIPRGAAPPSVQGFHAVQRKDGVLLQWQDSMPVPDAMVEVVRTDLTPRPILAKPTSGAKATSGASRPFAMSRKSVMPTEVLLRPDGTQAPGSTLHGMLDQTAQPERSYAYRAQRVLTLHADGKALTIFSEPTQPVTVDMRDTFPPDAPQGLVSIPGTTVQTPGAGSRPTIDLSWLPNTEADLAGYFVYRTDLGTLGSTAPAIPPVRLTASPVAGPAFRDKSVRPGVRYAYRVTAVDQKGNESAPSAPVEDSPEGR